MSEWIKCSERLPPEDKSVLIFTIHDSIYIARREVLCDQTMWPLVGGWGAALEAGWIKYWRELPAPPKEPTQPPNCS